MLTAFALHCFYLSFILHPSSTIKCYECIGFQCNDADSLCDGNYCFASSFVPTVGAFRSDATARFLKGCIHGTDVIPSEHEMNTCAVSLGTDEIGTVIQSCICDGSYCTGDLDSLQKKQRHSKLQCDCDGFDYCHDGCFGDACTYVNDLSDGQERRGCSNTTFPLVDYAITDACVEPGFLGDLAFPLLAPEKFLEYRMCTCAGQFCNREEITLKGRDPDDFVECPMEFAAKVEGKPVQHRNGSCFGDVCFSVRLKDGGEFEISVRGCLNFTEVDNDQPLELDKCSRIEGPDGFDGEFCLLQKTVERVGTSVSLMDVNGGVQTSRLTTRRRTTIGDQTIELADPEAASVRREEQTAASAKDGGKAAMGIFFFVVIVVSIVGVVAWKFDLKSKIFHSAYQSVV